MKPVKGGNLVNLPEKAKEIMDNLDGGSAASYAIRFAAGFDGIMMVLSGMGDKEYFAPMSKITISRFAAIQLLKSKNLKRVKTMRQSGLIVFCCIQRQTIF